MARDVEGVEAAGVAHLRAERERLAAGAGAEVDHHLAAFGAGEQREQLAAFVLHFDQALLEHVETLQRGLADDADAERRIRRRRGFDARGLRRPSTSSRSAFSALTRRSSGAGASRRVDPGPEPLAETCLQRLGQPLRQVVAQPLGQRREIEGLAALEPIALAFVERRAQDAGVALPGEDRQAALHLAAAAVGRAGEMAIERQPPHQRERAVGERRALARAERALLAEEVGDDAVGRMLEAQDAVHELGRGLEQGVRMHRGDYPWPSGATTFARPTSMTRPPSAHPATPRPSARAPAPARLRDRRRDRRRGLARRRLGAGARPPRLERPGLALPDLGRDHARSMPTPATSSGWRWRRPRARRSCWRSSSSPR